MTDEEIKQKFKETYPDFMYGDTPLSPYFDIWCYAIEIMEWENNKLLDVINNQDVKIADLEKENKNLEGCLFAEQEHTLMSEKQIEKMKCCQNCKWQYCECSSAFIDKDTGKETKHCWNEEKEKYCDVGFEGKYQCWELRE